MLTFITSVRHPNNSFFYERVWDLLRDTLYSVCSQKCTEFKVIVVCNEVLDDFSDHHLISKYTEFVTVNLDAPNLVSGPITGVPACNLDRGLKYVVGLVAAKVHDPEYVMFFDADDFVSDKIVCHTSVNKGRTGWFFEKGTYYQDFQISNRLNFLETCGTSHILNYDILTKDIPFDRLTTEATKADIERYVHPYFIRGVLGCHMNYSNYFFNCHSVLEEWPLHQSAVYNMSTGENHSGRWSKCGPGWELLTKRKGFNRTLRHEVHRYKFPLIDHKRRLIPIDTTCSFGRKLFFEMGLQTSVHLNCKDVLSVYGRETCDAYTAFAFVSNPWERMVTEYNHYITNGEGLVSFDYFVRKHADLRSQSSLIADWVDEIHVVDEVPNDGFFKNCTKPTFEHNLSDYYTEDLKDLISLKFEEDIKKFGFKYQGEYTLAPSNTVLARYKTFGFSATILPRIELKFLPEWLDHHFSLGFEKCILYDNGFSPIDGSTWGKSPKSHKPDQIEGKHVWKKRPDADYNLDYSDAEISEAMQDLASDYKGKVSIIPWVYGVDHSTQYPYSQWNAIRHVASNNKNYWWLFIDPDEFLNMRLHDTVQEFVSKSGSYSQFRFKQRIFEERVAGKPVREIFNFGYDSDLSKNLTISNMMTGGEITAHEQSPSFGEIKIVPSDVANYHHYRGDPSNTGNEYWQHVRLFESAGGNFDSEDYSMKKYLL
jgi:hypothetical protein